MPRVVDAGGANSGVDLRTVSRPTRLSPSALQESIAASGSRIELINSCEETNTITQSRPLFGVSRSRPIQLYLCIFKSNLGVIDENHFKLQSPSARTSSTDTKGLTTSEHPHIKQRYSDTQQSYMRMWLQSCPRSPPHHHGFNDRISRDSLFENCNSQIILTHINKSNMSSASIEIQPVPMSPNGHGGISPVANSDSTTKPAVTSTVSSPIQPSRASLNATKRVSGPPPGYKLIKRRKEDGTSITVMRKMTPEEIEMAEQKSPAKLNPVAQENIAYKIITVRDSDGALIRVKRPIKPEASVLTPSLPAENTKDNTLDPVNKQGDSALSPSLKISELKSPAMSSFTNDTVPETPKAADIGSPVIEERPIGMEAALQQQKEEYRRKRTQKFRSSLIRGFGTMLGSSIGHLDLDMDDELHHSHEPAGDIEDGDIIDSDQSWSDDDDDNDDGGVDDEHDHGNDDSGERGHGELKLLYQGF